MENTPTDPLIAMAQAGGKKVEKGMDKIAKIAMVVLAIFFVITAIVMTISEMNNKAACEFVFKAFRDEVFSIPIKDFQDFNSCMFYCNSSMRDTYKIDSG